MKRILTLLIIAILLCASGCNSPGQPSVPEDSGSESHNSYMVVGKLDVYHPDNKISIAKPVKISSREELEKQFADCDILPALQSFYDEEFFKKNVLIVCSSFFNCPEYNITQSFILDKTLYVTIRPSGDSKDGNTLFCLRFGNGIVGETTDWKVEIR